MNRNKIIARIAARELPIAARLMAQYARQEDQSREPDICSEVRAVVDVINASLFDTPITRNEINALVMPILVWQANAFLGTTQERWAH